MSEPTAESSLEIILERLQKGDLAAAEKVFLAFAPYLRILVRRHLPSNMRAHFDSMDIVQSVWVDVLDGLKSSDWEFADVNRLRAFLVKATRNRLIDRCRHHNCLSMQSLGSAEDQHLPAAGGPAPSEEAMAADLWDKLMSVCPPAHKTILQLKRQGCDLAEISQRTGMHPSSVRRILYDLARRLALR